MTGRAAWPIVVSLIVLAALQSATEAVDMLGDTQSGQRATLQLVSASKLRDRRGYQVEGALFCARDPDPLPTMFSQDIWRRFKNSPQASRASADFIAEFRHRPIAYMVESYRLHQFPAAILAFFEEHYVWYARSLFIAGFHIESAGGPRDVDVIVPAAYRWVPDLRNPDATIRVGPTSLHPLAVIVLDVGMHRVALDGPNARGSLMLADLPASGREAYRPFYDSRQILQLGGHQ
jgi:hypothetical protein